MGNNCIWQGEWSNQIINKICSWKNLLNSKGCIWMLPPDAAGENQCSTNWNAGFILCRVIGRQPLVYGPFRLSSSLSVNEVARSQRTRKKPTQTWEEHADSLQKWPQMPGVQTRDLLTLIFHDPKEEEEGAFPISHTKLPKVIHFVPISLRESFSLSHLPRCPRSMLRQSADLLSHQRGLEGRQSQGLHVVPAFPLHPEVQSLPGSLVVPRKLMTR